MTEQEQTEETSDEEIAPAANDATAQPPGEAADAPKADVRPAKKEKEAAQPGGPPTAVVEPKNLPGTPIISRRRILQVGFWSGVGAAIAGAAGSGLDFIYPRNVSGFGGTVSVGPADVPPPGQKIQIPVGRFWLVNLTEEQGGPGLLALWWKCPHLGCTVPWKPNFIWPDPTTGAPKQGWFRCPCHGSTYTDAGIRVFGPAPRSLDTMDLSVGSDGRVSVNTGSTTPGGPDNPDRAVRL